MSYVKTAVVVIVIIAALKFVAPHIPGLSALVAYL